MSATSGNESTRFSSFTRNGASSLCVKGNTSEKYEKWCGIMPHYTKMQAYVLDFCLWCVITRESGDFPPPCKEMTFMFKGSAVAERGFLFWPSCWGLIFAGPFHFLSWGFCLALLELQLVLLVAAGSPLVLIWYSSAHRYELCCQDAILLHVLMFVPLLSPLTAPQSRGICCCRYEEAFSKSSCVSHRHRTKRGIYCFSPHHVVHIFIFHSYFLMKALLFICCHTVALYWVTVE